MAAQTKLAPFRNNTRQRWAKVFPAAAITLGASGQIPFPQVGLMSRIFLFVNAVVTDTNAAPVTPTSTFGPFNLVKRMQGTLNLGTSNVFDLSGYGAYMVDKLTDTAVETARANADQTGADAFYQYPAAFAANVGKAVSFCFMIPIAANDGPQFALGLINLQSPELRFNLNLQFGQAADLFPGGTNATQSATGTVQAYYQYYEVPDPDTVELPARAMHRLLEDRTPITGTGDITYLAPRQGVLLQMAHNVILNGVIDKTSPAGGNVIGRRLQFNKTDTPYSVDPIVDRIESRMRYGLSASGFDLPSGMYVWDFFDSDQAPARGDLRDAIDTEALSTLESIVTLASTAVLGAGNNFLDTVRRVMQQY